MSPEELAAYEEERKAKDRERKKQDRALAKEAAERMEAGQMDSGPGRTVAPDDPHIFESNQAHLGGMDGLITDKGIHLTDNSQSTSQSKRSRGIPNPADIHLKWKGKQQSDLSDVKLITGSEAEDKIEKLTDLFVRGSNILDQILQIIVKGHEEVNIWTLDDDTARIFASMKVEAAKKDKQAAAEVRRLEAIHDKLFALTVFAPRAVATVVLVRQKGLGFR